VADDTIILNRGVGGDTTDASNVGASIKRERVVIGGDTSRAQIVDPVPDTGIWRLPVSVGPQDAFGRLRTGSPQTLFDTKFLNDNQPLYWDDAETSGGGTSSTFNTNQASVTLAVSAATAGTRVRQTFRRFQYQPGKSQFFALTGVIGTAAVGITRRIGAFDAQNGVFFESAPAGQRVVVRTFTSGVAVDNGVAQAAWNIDPMDGTGPSGVTLDFSKTQIFAIDFQWLGVGTVRFGFYIDGILYYCHAAQHANIETLVYMSTPNLPLRYEIVNDGTGGAVSLVQICASVISEGGSQDTGATRAASRNATGLTTINNASLYPLIAIRLQAGFQGASVRAILASVVCATNNEVEAQILLNPTVVGTALAFTALTNSVVEADVGTTNATTVTGGTVLAAASVAQASQLELSQPSDFQIGSSIAGVMDILVLAVRRLTGAAETFYGALNWRESN
jgi:hypothetical protein